MRWLSEAAVPQGVPEHREHFDAHAGSVVPEHRGAESEPVQKDLRYDLRGPQQPLSQTSTTELGLVPRDNGHVAEEPLGRLSPSHPHQPVLVRATYRQRSRGAGQRLQGAA